MPTTSNRLNVRFDNAFQTEKEAMKNGYTRNFDSDSNYRYNINNSFWMERRFIEMFTASELIGALLLGLFFGYFIGVIVDYESRN